MAFNYRSVPLLRSTKALKALAGTAALSIVVTNASATWSILITDTRTGEIVIGSATCVAGIDLRQETPVLIGGVGAVTAQSAVDNSGRNRMILRDRLLQGVPLDAVLDELSMVDSGHANRQYGMITAKGDVLTYSGVENANWAGGITGRIEQGRPGPLDDIVYTVQGNILSGPNVVQDAVNAILAADNTDLPGRLMAGMLAARFGGGDGRCSCSPSDPTGCGSPPPGPFKSADVGYMLGTRGDNRDSVPAFYAITNSAGGMTLADLNHDGMNDVLVGDAVNSEVSIFMNSATPGDPLSHVLLNEVRTLPGSQIVGMSTGDFNNDGYDDVAAILASPPTLAVMMGRHDGGLDGAMTIELGAIPTGLASGDLLAASGDEIVISLGSIAQVKTFSLASGSIVEQGSISLSGNPSTILVGQLAGDPVPDLAIARQGNNSVWIGENQGAGVFVQAADIPTANDPVKLAMSDLNLNGSDELVVLSGSGRRVEIFEDNAGAWTRLNDFGVNRIGQGLAIGVFTPGDAFPDIITTSSAPRRNLQLFAGDGLGGFTFQDLVKVGSSAHFVALDDMNGNGDLDIVVTNANRTGLMLLDNPQGGPLPKPGRFADGDYFLELNIPNQRMDDPDPVDQLHDLFNAWRAGLTGRVDAVHSLVIGRSRVSTGSSHTVTIELRDWQGQLLDISDPGSWSLSTMSGLFDATTPTMIEPGVFEFTLNAAGQIGTGELVIRVGDGTDQVRIMPGFRVYVSENIADFNADGMLDMYDIAAFLRAVGASDLDADLTGDGVINFDDVSAFLIAYSG